MRPEAQTPGDKGCLPVSETYIDLKAVQRKNLPTSGVDVRQFSSDKILMRTNANAKLKFNQFILAPYIGPGSPIDQTMWIDQIRVATGRP